MQSTDELARKPKLIKPLGDLEKDTPDIVEIEEFIITAEVTTVKITMTWRAK
jgi:hypothetical protein